MVLLALFDAVDDTVAVKKSIISVRHLKSNTTIDLLAILNKNLNRKILSRFCRTFECAQ